MEPVRKTWRTHQLVELTARYLCNYWRSLLQSCVYIDCEQWGYGPVSSMEMDYCTDWLRVSTGQATFSTDQTNALWSRACHLFQTDPNW